MADFSTTSTTVLAVSGDRAIALVVELAVIATVGYLLFRLGRWIYRDATARGSEWAWQWATGIPMLMVAGIVPGLLVLIVYLQLRNADRRQPAHEESTSS